MQPGCGLKVRKIKGKWYVYVWHFNGPRRGEQVELYVGPAALPRTREKALRLLLEHEGQAQAALQRRLDGYRRALSRIGA